MYDRSAKLSAKGVVIEYWLHRSRTLFTAVQGVDLSVKGGEFVAIVGPSGCGKTTFLNAVDGLQPISSGSLSLNGQPIQGPGRDRSMVFQQPSLLPWRTVWSNVIYGIEIQRSLQGAEARPTVSKVFRRDVDEHGGGVLGDARPPGGEVVMAAPVAQSGSRGAPSAQAAQRGTQAPPPPRIPGQPSRLKRYEGSIIGAV